jgi:two-component system, NarL family, response regulator LiaR
MRAAVIEDQGLVRDYLAGVLRLRLGIAEVMTIESMAQLQTAVAALDEMDLVLFDIDLGDGSTLDWAIARAARGTPPCLVALSSITGLVPWRRLQEAGLSVVHKNDGEDELVDAIRRSLAGAIVLSRRAAALVQEGQRNPDSPLKLLGPREREVLALLGQRLLNDDIAELLGCSPVTVADHRKRIMRKLGVHGIEDLIDYAITHGLIYESRAMAAHHLKRPAGGSPPR